jgi:hypothetical protein
MADSAIQVQLFSVSIPHKAGEGARVLGALRDSGINLIALWGYSTGSGRARLELIPEDPAAFSAAAKRLKIKTSKSAALYIQGDDRRGAIAEILAKLGAARINVGALHAVAAGAGRYGAVVFLPAAALRKAAGILGGG